MNYRNFYTSILLFLSLIILLSCQDSDKNRGGKEFSNDTTKISSDTFRKVVNVNLGDFDMMFERRIIRVLAPYSRTLFFNDKGLERGITAETVREFERYLNEKYRRKLIKRPITVTIIGTPRDQLFSDVSNGLGDIAAGNLTVTKNRLEQVDFMAPPDLQSVSEIVLTHKQMNPINSVEDLAGRTVHARISSSYYESLQKLNKKFDMGNLIKFFQISLYKLILNLPKKIMLFQR